MTLAAVAVLRFDADEYRTTAGVVEFALTGEPGHTLQFRELDYEGFPLDASGNPPRGKVTLEPGTYQIYCTVIGHAATMHATVIAEPADQASGATDT